MRGWAKNPFKGFRPISSRPRGAGTFRPTASQRTSAPGHKVSGVGSGGRFRSAGSSFSYRLGGLSVLTRREKYGEPQQIRAALSFAYKHWDLKNPFAKIEPPLHKEPQIRYLLLSDIRRLLDYLKVRRQGYGSALAFHLANALFQLARGGFNMRSLSKICAMTSMSVSLPPTRAREASSRMRAKSVSLRGRRSLHPHSHPLLVHGRNGRRRRIPPPPTRGVSPAKNTGAVEIRDLRLLVEAADRHESAFFGFYAAAFHAASP